MLRYGRAFGGGAAYVAAELSSAFVSSAVHGSPRPGSNREPLVQGQVGLPLSPRGCDRPAAIRTRTPSPRTRCACRLRHGADYRQNGTEPPNDGGAQTSDVKTPTASRTRFSEVWRRYLLAASLTAVGRRIVLPDSAMPCASWDRSLRCAPIWKFRRGHSIPELPALREPGDRLRHALLPRLRPLGLDDPVHVRLLVRRRQRLVRGPRLRVLRERRLQFLWNRDRTGRRVRLDNDP